MIYNVWNAILEWFSDTTERDKLIKDFNYAAKLAFIQGNVPSLLKSKKSKGNRAYKHKSSNWLQSGLRVEAFAGKSLSIAELRDIGYIILASDTLVRQLIVLGFDTLEVNGDISNCGCWELTSFLRVGGSFNCIENSDIPNHFVVSIDREQENTSKENKVLKLANISVANCENAEIVEENKALKQVTENIEKELDEKLVAIICNVNPTDPLMIDSMCKASIEYNIEQFKSNTTLQQLSGLNIIDFEKLVDKIAIEVMDKYF